MDVAPTPTELFLMCLPPLLGILGGTAILPFIISIFYRSLKAVYGYSNSMLDQDAGRTQYQHERERFYLNPRGTGLLQELLITGGLCGFSSGVFCFFLIQGGFHAYLLVSCVGGIAGAMWVLRQKRREKDDIPAYRDWLLGAWLGAPVWGLMSFFGLEIQIIFLIGVLGLGYMYQFASLIENKPGTPKEPEEYIYGLIFRKMRGIGFGTILIFLTLLDVSLHGRGECVDLFSISLLKVRRISGYLALLYLPPLFLTEGFGVRIFSKFFTLCLALCRFRTTLCRHCFQYTSPLKSRYVNGQRYCEYCGQEVELTKDLGRLIFSFGICEERPAGKSIVALSNPDLETKERRVDVSAVYLHTKTCNKLLLERFLTYIVNYPPKHGVQSVQIFYQGSLDDLGDHLKNAFRNTFNQIQPQGMRHKSCTVCQTCAPRSSGEMRP